MTEQPRSSYGTISGSVGNASASSSGGTTLSVSEADCQKAKDCCKSTLKYGTAVACFAGGWGARTLYDEFTRSSKGDASGGGGYSSSTTTSPWGRDHGYVSKFGRREFE